MEQGKKRSFKAAAVLFLASAVLAMAVRNGSAAYAFVKEEEAEASAGATAVVTEHIETDGDGNVLQDGTKSEASDDAEVQPKDGEDSFAGDGRDIWDSGLSDESQGQAAAEGHLTQPSWMASQEKSREFYTIRAAGGKVFYLIIDRDGNQELVHFLTDVTEDDLKATGEASETGTPTAQDSGLPFTGPLLPENGTDGDKEALTESGTDSETGTGEDTDSKDTLETDDENEDGEKKSPFAMYAILAFLGAVVVGGGYYLKVVRKREEGGFVEDEEEEPDPDYESDEEEDEDDFFKDDSRDEETEPGSTEGQKKDAVLSSEESEGAGAIVPKRNA